MSNDYAVEHQGIVESHEDGKVRVRFIAHPSCSSCHARGACSLSEQDTKYVDADTAGLDLHVGEEVEIMMEPSMGLRAVLYGYLLPLGVLMATIILVYLLSGSEALSALLGIGVLVPYYAGLYFMNDRLSRSFRFRVRKQIK